MEVINDCIEGEKMWKKTLLISLTCATCVQQEEEVEKLIILKSLLPFPILDFLRLFKKSAF
jgi:hypothetical protein